jgi:6-phosphofructokinase 1
MMVEQLREMKRCGRTSIIVVVAEGDEEGGVDALNRELVDAGCPYPIRSVKLGHVQRGGPPSPMDRILASRLGDFAVQSLVEGATGEMTGLVDGKLVLTPFRETYQTHKSLPTDLLGLMDRIAR